ncbi:MAG: transposase zinc-binding domain-containing protein [Gemmatimonadaceae bacterium]
MTGETTAFSCKCRYFCPSCHAKRLALWAAWLDSTLLAPVPHRQVVLAIPTGHDDPSGGRPDDARTGDRRANGPRTAPRVVAPRVGPRDPFTTPIETPILMCRHAAGGVAPQVHDRD